jgi:uncharacterized membrane protein YeaQ/YmgE (transglycosylase-associated protein family)
VGLQVPKPNRIPALARKLLLFPTVDPGAGLIVWVAVAVVTGWLATRFMGSFARPTALTNISVAIIGAIAAGLATRGVLASLGYENLAIAGIAGALLGSCLLIFAWQAMSRPQV